MNHGPDSTPGITPDSTPDSTPGTDRDPLAALFGAGAGAGIGAGTGMGADADEDALRRMMRGAVQGLEPRDGTLDHLYRAVPARRARRRQALVGAAAAALLIGTAIPAFLHVAHSEGSNAAGPAIAGHGEQAHGGSGEEPGPGSGGADDGGGSEGHKDTGAGGVPDTSASPSASSGQGVEGTAVGSSADPRASVAADMPVCSPDQLGVASARTGATGADGTVYGTFRIANVSGKDCSVSSGGTVGFEAMGAADPAKIAVVRHTPGDAASGLPDPAEEEATVLLAPEMAYEVQFAWVPEDTCPTTGGSPSPTPTDGTAGSAVGSAGAATSGGGTGDTETGTDTQLGSEDESGTAEGSVAVKHTAEPGAPVAETKIANACAGTIYRTGALEPSPQE
ncbi:hypothetical protein [Streptomyces sp. AC154]|uniref:hypothetical protein n=1 Tax=Streptomyces sp. AC154 TaxID=3143184 RepID=UPI003F7D8EC3